jgi:hypothetical protein
METKFLKIFFCLLLIPIFWACKNEDKTQDDNKLSILKIEINHLYNNQALAFNTPYTTPAGDIFRIQNFKYYIHPIAVGNTNVSQKFYTLINPAINKNIITITFPGMVAFQQIRFAIGVDSLNNSRIDFTGDLNPNNDMAWDWNTGYKFLLLEGTYIGDTTQGPLVYHIGGNENYRIFTLNFSSEKTILKGRALTVKVNAHINNIFDNPNLVDLDINNNEMFGPYTSKIADNYSTDMFSVVND